MIKFDEWIHGLHYTLQILCKPYYCWVYITGTTLSNLPMGLWQCRQTLPIHPGNEPLPLRFTDRKTGVIDFWPNETTPVQAAMAKPNAVPVPHQ
jgi:hypothetical protein